MPNLPTHVFLVNQVVERLDWGCLSDNLGSVFLGSTAPDMRAMTKWPRERTHFSPLSVDEVGTGLRAMFRLHPELADYEMLSNATRAFILGYISHLVADEVWIIAIYRPCFSPPEGSTMAAGNKVEAHIWDRALQLDMDRRALPHVGDHLQAIAAMPADEVGLEVGFLGAEALGEWKEWVGRFVAREFSWERLRRSLNRMYRGDDDVQQAVDGFLEEMPGSLERVYERIPREQIDAYQQRVVDETVAQAREHWGPA
jgi:hypothetical protein|tara:strand:+ start:4075 stop:4842 length:768 start_codon:yes stop_codon:yes gene_type:complete